MNHHPNCTADSCVIACPVAEAEEIASDRRNAEALETMEQLAARVSAAACNHDGIGLPGCTVCDPLAEKHQALGFKPKNAGTAVPLFLVGDAVRVGENEIIIPAKRKRHPDATERPICKACGWKFSGPVCPCPVETPRKPLTVEYLNEALPTLCAYCESVFIADAAGCREHIKGCPKHPMRKLEAVLTLANEALSRPCQYCSSGCPSCEQRAEAMAAIAEVSR